MVKGLGMGLSSNGEATPVSVSGRTESVVFMEEDEPKEWIAQVEPGVLITLVSILQGGNDLKRIRFRFAQTNLLRVYPKGERVTNNAVSPGSLVPVTANPALNASWHKMVDHDKFALVKAADCYSMHTGFKPPDGISNQIVTGLMTVIMGIVTMVRLTRTMPKKLTDATLYSTPMYCYDPVKGPGNELVEPGISNAEFMTVMKRMAAMEEKIMAMSVKPDAITEKEEMLQVATTRVDALEQELNATKKFTSKSMWHSTSHSRRNPKSSQIL